MRLLGVLLGAVLLSAVSSCSDTDVLGGEPSGEQTEQVAPADTEVCAQVRAGIAAFNEGDYDQTIAQFREAVPLAERQADAADGEGAETADLLVEAVRYYAELPADQYLEAAATSPEFERWKQLTLGLCVEPGQQPTPEPPGVET